MHINFKIISDNELEKFLSVFNSIKSTDRFLAKYSSLLNINNSNRFNLSKYF